MREKEVRGDEKTYRVLGEQGNLKRG